MCGDRVYDAGGSRFERRRAVTALHPALSTILARPLRTAEAAIRYHGVGGVTQIPAAALEVTPAEAAVLHWVDIDFI